MEGVDLAMKMMVAGLGAFIVSAASRLSLESAGAFLCFYFPETSLVPALKGVCGELETYLLFTFKSSH